MFMGRGRSHRFAYSQTPIYLMPSYCRSIRYAIPRPGHWRCFRRPREKNLAIPLGRTFQYHFALGPPFRPILPFDSFEWASSSGHGVDQRIPLLQGAPRGTTHYYRYRFTCSSGGFAPPSRESILSRLLFPPWHIESVTIVFPCRQQPAAHFPDMPYEGKKCGMFSLNRNVKRFLYGFPIIVARFSRSHLLIYFNFYEHNSSLLSSLLLGP